ncbi:terpene synthase 10-like [Olea europaea var. sylvestris]|uniref:terpene synthase 10-like n=1 Tax=Olea europaea var. sylvestris TaxID=158386 RepID=UPI000C1D5B1D|nr:terpene synthase 10-like [Olea europaea var. sylvestris]
MTIFNLNIFKAIYIRTSKKQNPKHCFALCTTTAANANQHSFITNTRPCSQVVIRRSGNYKPSGERYATRSSGLKMQVKMMLDKTVEPLDQLELIENLQRLGISYHFENEIKQILSVINKKYSKNDQQSKIEDLYATALEFRLLRQHGFKVSEGIFDRFKNEKGEFKSRLCDDIEGLLQLYETSFLSMEGESTLEMATEFSMKHLNDQTSIDQFHSRLVHHGLELPLHWTIPRAEARWFINIYKDRPDMNQILLELAKLDFNIVQAKYQQELKHISRYLLIRCCIHSKINRHHKLSLRNLMEGNSLSSTNLPFTLPLFTFITWWKGTCLAEKLSFARVRLVECFFWTTGVIFEPQYEFCRKILTKVNALVTTIDDMYDVYGTLEELEVFTRIIERWDLNSIHQLPDYMQICYLALNNFVNEMAYDILKEKGFIIIPYLKKAVSLLFKAYLQEARWYFNGYKPTMEEYMNIAWISISTHVILSHAFFTVTSPIEKEAVQYLLDYPDLIHWSATILRLSDDLVTSMDEMKRGDVPKTIQCYMNETGASEDEAREHIISLIRETWKKMNQVQETICPFSKTFIEIAMNLARMAQYMYQYGDGHGIQNHETKDRILALLFEPLISERASITPNIDELMFVESNVRKEDASMKHAFEIYLVGVVLLISLLPRPFISIHPLPNHGLSLIIETLNYIDSSLFQYPPKSFVYLHLPILTSTALSTIHYSRSCKQAVIETANCQPRKSSSKKQTNRDDTTSREIFEPKNQKMDMHTRCIITRSVSSLPVGHNSGNGSPTGPTPRPRVAEMKMSQINNAAKRIIETIVLDSGSNKKKIVQKIQQQRDREQSKVKAKVSDRVKVNYLFFALEVIVWGDVRFGVTIASLVSIWSKYGICFGSKHEVEIVRFFDTQ